MLPCDFPVIDLAELFNQMQYRWNNILNKTRAAAWNNKPKYLFVSSSSNVT